MEWQKFGYVYVLQIVFKKGLTPCKKLFPDWNLSIWEQNFEMTTFFVKTTLFCKQEDWKTPCLVFTALDG